MRCLPLGTISGDSGDVCFNEPITVPCGALRKVNGADDVEWKVYDAESSQWIWFSYCIKRMACVVMEPILPNGITVKNISNGTLTFQASAKNNTNGQSRLLCQVHYGQNSVDHDEVNISFTVCKFSCTAFCVKLCYIFNRPHFLSVYRRNNPRGMSGENTRKVCKSRAECE